MAIRRAFKESLQQCLLAIEIRGCGLGGDGKPWRIGTEFNGNRDHAVWSSASYCSLRLDRGHSHAPRDSNMPWTTGGPLSVAKLFSTDCRVKAKVRACSLLVASSSPCPRPV
jgi:hypothetical protein